MLRMPKFLRRWIRRKTDPLTIEDVYWWKSRISIVYAFVAWNAFGFVAYQIFVKKKQNWATNTGDSKVDESPALWWAKVIGVEKAKVYHVSGFTFKQTGVSDLDLKNEENPLISLDREGCPIDKKIPNESFEEKPHLNE